MEETQTKTHAKTQTRARTQPRARPKPKAGTKPRFEGKDLPQLVREAIDRGATTAEEIHKSIAGLPLDVLEKIEPFEGKLEGVRRIQDLTIGAVYDLVRKINEEVTSLASDMLAEAEKARSAGGSRRPSRHAA